MYTLGDIAAQLGLRFTGDAGRLIAGPGSLETAGPDQLAFMSQRRYLHLLETTRAAAVIIAPAYVDHCPVACLISDDPYLSFARVSALFARAPRPAAGIHPAATVADSAVLAPDVSIAANAVVEAGAVLGPQVAIGAGVYIGHNCRIGRGTRIFPNAVLYHGVVVGEDCTIHAQAVIGGDGFGFAPGPAGWEKIHQLGGVVLGNRVEVGAGTTIDRGAIDDTVIGDGAIIDNLVQIAHNCRIGKNTAIAGCAGLAGSTIIGANCTLAGGVGVVGHVEICDNVHITGMTMVTKSIAEPGSYSSGTPMTSTRQWKRSAVRFTQLDSMEKRLARVEDQIDG